MNIHNLRIKIPKCPVIDPTPPKRKTSDLEWYVEDNFTPTNSPTYVNQSSKKVKYTNNTSLESYNTIDEFIHFYCENPKKK